jgi:hypothetical protein
MPRVEWRDRNYAALSPNGPKTLMARIVALYVKPPRSKKAAAIIGASVQGGPRRRGLSANAPDYSLR